LKTKPTQVTLVPDDAGQLTSNHGWNTIEHRDFLTETISLFQSHGIRVSIFVDPIPEMIAGAKATGTNRIELYTESYAVAYNSGKKEEGISPFILAANKAAELELEINAGHDLDLHNLSYFAKNIPGLKEVSIGHALVCDAIVYGMENTVSMYKRQLTFS